MLSEWEIGALDEKGNRRRSHNRGGSVRASHMVGARAGRNGVVVEHVKTDKKWKGIDNELH